MEENNKLIPVRNNVIMIPEDKQSVECGNKLVTSIPNSVTVTPELEKLLSVPNSVTITSKQNKLLSVPNSMTVTPEQKKLLRLPPSVTFSPEQNKIVTVQDSVTVTSEQNKLVVSVPKKLISVPNSVTVIPELKKLLSVPNSVNISSEQSKLVTVPNSVNTVPELNKLVSIPNSVTITTEVKRTNNGSRRPALRSQSSRSSTRSRYRGPGSSAYRKLRRRAVFKNGDCNVIQCHVSKRRRRYLQDIFTTLVDTQWRWTILVFALSFLSSWFGFGCIWWLIAYSHGDLEPENLKPDSDWSPCVDNIKSFASCFLFSLETQHTIGYGGRATTEECPEAIITMCMQSIWGMMIQAFMVGIIFAKMARPKQRTQTLLFSRNAVICQRDGQLCLMFRVGDMREKSHLINAQIRAQMIRPRATKEGEYLSPFLTELKLNVDDYSSDIFLIWPKVVVHKIDSASPLYTLSAADLINERFEIVVILEGTTESTGQTTQARSSYLPPEILWGHRFEPLVSYNKERLSYQVDYSLFHNTYQVDTPLCSAQELQTFTEASGALTFENNYAFT